MNQLTKKLLAQGYAHNNYPPYVRPIRNYWDKDTFYKTGGFEYQPWN